MWEIKPIFHALLRSKAGALMLLIQIAITTAIVSNAAFIISDKLTYLQQETGYPEDEIFSFAVLTYGKDKSLTQVFEEDETMLRNLPGVIDASLFSNVPLSGSGSTSSFHLDADATNSKSIRSSFTISDEHGLHTLGLKVVEGRGFTAEDVQLFKDNSTIPTVMVVSRSFVDDMFPNENGLGKTVYMGPNPIKIIGIVDKMMGPWLKDSAANNTAIFPMSRSTNFQNIVVRTNASDRQIIMGQIEDRMLAAYDKRVVVGLMGLDEAKNQYNAGDVLMMRMLIVLIVVLVLVTALGIFGLTVFNINKRTKQIGTRRALGARKSAIVQYFLIENSMICIAGLLIGTLGALLLGQALFELYSLPELDYMYIVFTALSVMCFSLLSVVLPANKAANISPSVATRSI